MNTPKSLWKKGIVLGIIALFLGAGVVPNILTTTAKADDLSVVLNPTDDCLIKHDGPDINYGSSIWFEVRNEYGGGGSSGFAWDSLIKFDVSSIPSGSAVSSAYLKIYYYDYFTTNPAGRNLNLYRATSSWNEGTVTWNTQPSYASSPTTYSSVPSSFGWMTWNVTSDVQDFIDGAITNHGWKITDENYWGSGNIPETAFHPKEYSNSNYHPYLEITTAPTADFTYLPVNPTISDIVQFTDNSTDVDGYIASWNWDFGDGNVSSIPNPTHQYSSNGIYEVTLEVTDDDGLTDDISKIVPVGINIVHGRNIPSGWNLVAVPTTINKADFIIKYNGCYYNWAQSLQETIVNQYIFGWNAGQYYEFIDILEPWHGYWMYAYEDCEIWVET